MVQNTYIGPVSHAAIVL